MDEHNKQEWQREGKLIYVLEPTGKYHKGEELLQNRFTIRVDGAYRTTTDEEQEALAECIKNFLKEAPKPVAGYLLSAGAYSRFFSVAEKANAYEKLHVFRAAGHADVNLTPLYAGEPIVTVEDAVNIPSTTGA